MPAFQLQARPVERVWGRRQLEAPFRHLGGGAEPIGEIWFEAPAEQDPPLLVKYLFTSEKLSIQVHPGGEAAQARGYPRGKDEAWLVLNADPDAVIGLGLQRTVTAEELRQAALDGSIEDLVHWRPSKAGDFLYSPAGTIHAIGPGLSLIEIQQNLDLTYRLYDYGRPRELHLDDGIAVAVPQPYQAHFTPFEQSAGREIVAAGGAFVLERWRGQRAQTLHASSARPITLVPVTGRGSIDGQTFEAGQVWMANAPAAITSFDGGDLLVAYPGGEILSAGGE